MIVVRPIELRDIEGFADCVREVIRERQYLAWIEPFPLESTAGFVATNLRVGNPHFVADDEGRIVGWCDISRSTVPVETHTGVLGMGVAAGYRGQGVGERLLGAALDAARQSGFEQVALAVYGRNTRAAALYRKVGFVHAGTRIRGKKLDGEYDDIHTMSLLLDEAKP